MPETTDLPHEAKLTWYGKELEKKAEEEVYKKLLVATEYVKTRAQVNVSQSNRSSGPSSPGEYPRANTGRLRNSIFAEVDRKTLTGIVGTNLKYGLWLEYGTSGGKRIVATSGGLLSWVGRDGVRRYAKSVIQGAIKGRSYLRRTFNESQPKLKTVFEGQWPGFQAA